MRDSRRHNLLMFAFGVLLILSLSLLSAAPAAAQQTADQQRANAEQGGDPGPNAQPATGNAAVIPADVTLPMPQAVRKVEEFDFPFQSFTTFYSCSGLESKLKRILVALGADQAATRISVSGCAVGAQIARMPVARIHTTIPVEATPAAFAELQKTRPQRELAARVRKDQARDLDAPFPAQWKHVSLSRGSLGIDSGDCELIEQINRRVLTKMAVRVVDAKLTCSPGQSYSQPKLEVEALVELSTVTDAPGNVPGTSARQQETRHKETRREQTRTEGKAAASPAATDKEAS